MFQITYPDGARGIMRLEAFQENEPFEVFMEFALRGISWDFHGKLKKGNPLHDRIREADRRVRPSIFFLRGRHRNAHTLH